MIEEFYLHTSTDNPNNERTQLIDGVIHVYVDKNKNDEVQYKINSDYIQWNCPKIENDIFLTEKVINMEMFIFN